MRNWEEVAIASLVITFTLLVVVMMLSMGGMFAYCAFGDVQNPRYQYICGNSVDIK